MILIWYAAFPALSRLCLVCFPQSDPLFQVVVSVFAPSVGLIYAIVAGQVVASLWGRLYSVRSLLNRELAALELLEAKMQRSEKEAQRLFAEHAVAIDRSAERPNVLPPSRSSKLAELSALPSMREDSAVQDLVFNISDFEAERRAIVEIGYPRVLWATLRALALMLIVCFLILAQGRDACPVAMRTLFCVFAVTVFWVNHFCRDMSDLHRGEFKIDAEVLRRHTALTARATAFLRAHPS